MSPTLSPSPKIEITCPGCGFGASAPGDAIGRHATCPSCRARFQVQASSAEAATQPPPVTFADRRCPLCSGETLDSIEQSLEEKRCRACSGSLLEGAAAVTLVRDHLGIDPALLAELQTFTRGEPLSCPSCQETMQLLRLKGNDVDRCPRCDALWLDGGELLRLTSNRFGAEAPQAPSGTASPALEQALGTLPSLLIRQDAEVTAATLLLDWDHANYYDLRGPMGSVGVLVEKEAGIGSALLRNFLHSRRHLQAQMLDRHRSQVLLELDRPPWLFGYTMKVNSPALGREIGRVRRNFHPILRSYSLEDPMGRPFAQIASPFWRFWTFPVTSQGRPAATIRKKWSGLFKEYYTRGDDFELDFGAHPWTLEQRCLLVATAVAIDLDFFEQRVAN